MKLLFARRDSIVISVKHTKTSEYGFIHLDVMSINCPHFTEARLFLPSRASGRFGPLDDIVPPLEYAGDLVLGAIILSACLVEEN